MDVEEVKEGDDPAFSLSEEEKEEYQNLPKAVAFKRYMKAHRTEKCAHCNKFIGNHSEKAFAHCVQHETSKLKRKRALQEMEFVETEFIQP